MGVAYGSHAWRFGGGRPADVLTRLPDRDALVGSLRAALQRRGRSGTDVAAVIVDLDSFSDVNELLGHGRGDVVLMTLADRLRARFREADMVARLGGDNFGIACEGAGLTPLLVRLVTRVEGVVSQPIPIDDGELVVGASVGAAVAEEGDDDAEHLLAQARAAMDEHKRRSARSGAGIEALRI